MKKWEHFYVRSITISVDLEKISDINYQEKLKASVEKISSTFAKNDLFVRTLRFNIMGINPDDSRLDAFYFINKLKNLNETAQIAGIRWFNVAFELTKQTTKNIKTFCNIGYEIIRQFDNSFVNFIVAQNGIINPEAALIASQTVIKISKLSFNGFDNFRVGISLNPADFTPFFPFSFASEDLCFSVALEITEKMEHLLEDFNSSEFSGFQEILAPDLCKFVSFVDRLCTQVENDYSMKYKGIDMSLAPFPDEKVSVIKVLKCLGLDTIGSSGTFLLTSQLTDLIRSIIRTTCIKTAGFNGVMYSLLEDHLMCKANNRKLFTIDSLIGYSALCGCGLDMVPVPGNILDEELASIVLDVAAIALKLNKPLGVRVLPIPNGDANEFTQFDMDFVTNTRIMNLRNMYINDSIFSIQKLKYNS
jgi:uncharacterized protein